MAAESARNTGFEVQEYQVLVYFGNEHYWIEDQETPIQYGEILSEILNFDTKPFSDAVAYWQKCEDESDWENLNAARDAVYGEFEKLPFYNRCSRKPVREELETIKIDRGNGSSQWLIKRDTGDLKRWRQFANALSDLQYIQNRYAWFLDALLSNQEFEKKKGQKKMSLADLLKSASLEGKVENAWLGGRRSAAIPRESIRYMFYETSQGPELVECLTFDRLLHFAYIELMRGIQKGNIPKRCANCGRWFLQTPGATYAYCNLIAPGETHHAVCEGAPHAVERIVLWLNAGYILSLNGMLPRIKPTLMEGLKGRGLITPDRETCQFLHGQLLSLLHEKQLADSDSAYLSRLIVAELMVYLTRHLSRASGHADPHALKQDPDILRVYDYIGMHYSERLNIAQLSERFYMDKNTLTRRFKRLVGQTPGDYLRARRLDAARRMIAHGAGMQEACDSCGFSDYSAFYRAFRRAYGISPSAASGNAAGNGERA